MTEQESELMASKMADRLLVMVNMAERLKGVEMQANRIAAELDSEKATRARTNERMQSQLLVLQIANWKAAGAIGGLVTAFEIAKHFKVF